MAGVLPWPEPPACSPPGRSRQPTAAGSRDPNSIVRDLVEKHGGEISAQSEGPGRGACFTVRLPRLPLEALEPAGAAGPERS